MTGRSPQFFTIPAGTREARCRSCDQVVYWIVTAQDRRMPVSVLYDGAFAPTTIADGSGISHFVDCPHAKQHRRPRNA